MMSIDGHGVPRSGNLPITYFPVRLADALLSVLAICNIIAAPVDAQRDTAKLPVIITRDLLGEDRRIQPEQLYDFEINLRNRFARAEAPDEIFALASSSVRDFYYWTSGAPRELLIVCIYGDEAELELYVNYEEDRHFHRKLNAVDVKSIRDFVSTNNTDRLPHLVWPWPPSTANIVGGTACIYVHLDVRKGRRVFIHSPPSLQDEDQRDEFPQDNLIWQFPKLIDCLSRFADSDRLQVRYEFRRPIPGLKVLYADREKEIQALWKEDGKLCVKVGRFGYLGQESRVFAEGQLGRRIATPNLLVDDIFPITDPPIDRARSSSDGRWLAGIMDSEDDTGDELVCFDLQQKRLIRVSHRASRGQCFPLYYLEAHKAFLLAEFRVDPLHHKAPLDTWVRGYRLLDPATGATREVEIGSGHLIWFQHLPRRLQPVGGQPHVVWAALPESHHAANGTSLGRYDTKELRWLNRQTIPSLHLETKDIMVDEHEGKIYAVDRGHLLRFPLPPDIYDDSPPTPIATEVYTPRAQAQ